MNFLSFFVSVKFIFSHNIVSQSLFAVYFGESDFDSVNINFYSKLDRKMYATRMKLF